MIKSFYQYVQMVNEAGPPPPPPGGAGGGAPPPDPNAAGGAPPPPGGDPMGGLGGGMGGIGGGMGGDPMGGGAGGTQAPRAAINVTTVWDAIRGVLGKESERQEGSNKTHPSSEKTNKPKPKSLIQ